MKKDKIIELLQNEFVNDVSYIEIKESINSMDNKITVFYKDKMGLPGLITQTF